MARLLRQTARPLFALASQLTNARPLLQLGNALWLSRVRFYCDDLGFGLKPILEIVTFFSPSCFVQFVCTLTNLFQLY